MLSRILIPQGPQPVQLFNSWMIDPSQLSSYLGFPPSSTITSVFSASDVILCKECNIDFWDATSCSPSFPLVEWSPGTHGHSFLTRSSNSWSSQSNVGLALIFWDTFGIVTDCSKTEGWMYSWVMLSVLLGIVRWISWANLKTPVAGLVQS